MAVFKFNGTIPKAIKYKGNNVKRVICNDVLVWVQDITVTYSGACDGGTVNAHRYVPLITNSTSEGYGLNNYTYTLVVPYKKTISDALTVPCYLVPVLQDANGNTVKDLGKHLMNLTKGVDVRYLTLTWTDSIWYGNASSYTLYINSSGSDNKDRIRYPEGYNMTFTCTNTK